MYGVLEDQFSKDMTQKDAIALAAKALLASLSATVQAATVWI